jgi:ferrous iron transport protein A
VISDTDSVRFVATFVLRRIILNNVTAKDLTLGQQAIVSSFSDETLASYLAERGIVAGERLSVERIAPFGDPIAIRVSDHVLCLRRKEASAIQVRPEAI